MQPKNRRLVTEETLENYSGAQMSPVLSRIEDTNTRLSQVEAMAGLEPEAVTDAQTANLVQQPDSMTRGVLTEAYASFDVPASAAELDNATGTFVQAAARAKAQGRKDLRVAPGTYHVPGIHPDDIGGLFVVGDGVTLTGGNTEESAPNLYPVTTSRWDSVLTGHHKQASAGRGRIAIEVDDAALANWTALFPVVTDELDIPLSVAWHTRNGARWILEAHRHGWEILSHLPYPKEATDFLHYELEDLAKESYDAIQAVTGQDRMGFVYPSHGRNLETDRVLSKYYEFGRGLAGIRPYSPDGSYREWLTTSFPLDQHTQGGNAESTQRLKEVVNSLAASNSEMVMYMHYAVHNEARMDALRQFVQYAKSMGVVFTTSSQIVGGRGIIDDPYAEQSQTFDAQAFWARTTEQSYHGTYSHKFEATSNAQSSMFTKATIIPATKPGMFSIYRGSFRVKSSGDNELHQYTDEAGMRLASRFQQHNHHGIGSLSSLTVSSPAAQENTSIIPAVDWERFSSFIAVDSSVSYMSVGLNFGGIQPGGSPIYVDEIQYYLVDFVDRLEYEIDMRYAVAVAGNLGTVRTHIPNVAEHDLEIIQPRGISDPVTLDASYGNLISLRSDQVEDIGTVKIIVRPRTSVYGDFNFPSDGA